MEDNIKWDDDEPPVEGTVAPFGPAYGQSAFHPPPIDPEVEDLQGSVVSYPAEDKNAHGSKRTPGARRSVSALLLWQANQSLTPLQRHDSLGADPPNRNSGLENFGSQGWPPVKSALGPSRTPSRQSRQVNATPRAGMRSTSRLANGMRPSSVAQSDILVPNVAISVRAPSIMVDRPPSAQSLVSLAPTDPEMRYALDHPEASSPVASPPQSVRSRAELLPSRKSHSFYREHVGGGSAPNSPGPVQHSRNPATYQAYGSGLRSRVGSPLRQDLNLDAPPQAPSIHAISARAPQTPRGQPIRPPSPPRQAIIQAPPSPRRPPIQSTSGPGPRPLSSSTKPPPSPPPKDNQVIPAPPPPPPPVVRQFQTPASQRTQYGPQKPPELISTLRLRRVDPSHLPPDWPLPRESDVPPTRQGATPHGTPRANRIKAMSVRSGDDGRVRTIAAEQDLGDEHVQSHVHELTELDDHIIIHQPGEAEHFDDWHSIDENADIANHMQEVYEIVDAEDEPFVPPPEEIGTIHGASEEGDSTPKATNFELLPMDIEIHPPSERSPPRAGSSLYMVDENQLDRVEDMPERELIEMLKTPRTGYTNLHTDGGESVYQGLNPHTLDMLGKHHDEDLCILLQAVDDELQHPVVRKAVRRAISSRLRNLGMGDDYDVSCFDLGVSIIVLTRTLQTVKRDPKLNAELHQYAYGNSFGGHELPDDAPEWAKTLDAHVRELTETMKATQLKGNGRDKSKRNKLKYRGEDTVTVDRTEEEADRTTVTGFEGDSLHPGQAVDEGGLHYRPDTDIDHAEGTYGDTVRRGLMEESPGGQIYEEEIYKLRKRSGSPRSQAIWEIEEERARGELPMDDMHDGRGSEYHNGDRRIARPNLSDNPLSPNAIDSAVDAPDWLTRFGIDPNEPPPWLKVYQRLLNWAIVWPFSEFDGALQSCQRGEQVDEVALSIWTTQVYKRYVRAQLTQYPPRPTDKMFVPPNLTDAINNAVYNGRHADAAGMLRDLWYPFGFSGSPRIILALGRHRREDNHWVAHRYAHPCMTHNITDGHQ